MIPMVELYLNYFTSHGFSWQQNNNVLSNNSKLLFNISGGVVYEDVIATGQRPALSRIASSQRCVRTDSWRKIGSSGRHHLAFDMLGHFSLYERGEREAKELMMSTAWGFLRDAARLSSKKLLVTVHPADVITQKIWQALGVIKIIPNENNVDINPTRTRSGLRTEICFHNGETLVELWNIVFTQFDGSKVFDKPLPLVAVDSGLSLDRLMTADEGLVSNYDNSLWRGVITQLMTKTRTTERTKVNRLADTGRAIAYIAGAGFKPGNKGAAYVFRKVIREAYLVSNEIGLDLNHFVEMACCPWLELDSVATSELKQLVDDEITQFQRCLERGERACSNLIRKRGGQLLPADITFLFDTFGYPEVLTRIQQEKLGVNHA